MKNYHISLTDIFGIIFVILKLVGVISWSWWWVLSPFWIKFIVACIAIYLQYKGII